MGRARAGVAKAGITLDAGALIALDRGEKRMIALLRQALEQGCTFRVPSGVLGQAWRDGRVQVTLARFLRSEEVEIIPLDEQLARALWRTLRRHQHVGYYRCVGSHRRQRAARPHHHKRSRRPAAFGSVSPNHPYLNFVRAYCRHLILTPTQGAERLPHKCAAGFPAIA